MVFGCLAIRLDVNVKQWCLILLRNVHTWTLGSDSLPHVIKIQIPKNQT